MIEPVPNLFDTFWSLYPKKEGKRYAMKCFLRLSPADQAAAVAAIPKHVRKWAAEEREQQYIPDASTWINNARWEDEIVVPVKASQKPLANSHLPFHAAAVGEHTDMPADVRERLRSFRLKSI